MQCLYFLVFFFFFCRSRTSSVVHPVTTETPEVYECKNGAHAADMCIWKRQNGVSLPEGIKVDGNRLYFTDSSSNLNGIYICCVETDDGTFCSSLYRKVSHSPLLTILQKVSTLWKLI